jgi:hypothetical protein
MVIRPHDGLHANYFRHEPIFAQNLGFCAGDLDTDFLEQLQRPLGA